MSDNKQTLYLVSRRIQGENEDCSMTLVSTVDKAVAWIEKYGREWEERAYFFVVMSFVLDFEEEHQPIDELYFFDQQGKKLERQPF